MRRHDHGVEFAQRRLLRRLDFINVERSAGHLAGPDGVVQIRLIDDAAAGAIDQPDAVFHLGNRVFVDHPARLVGHRNVNGDEIGARVDFVEFDNLDLQRFRAAEAQEWIVGEHTHAERDGAAGDFAADAAHADDAKCLVVVLDAFEGFAIPLTGFDRAVGLWDFAGERHEHRKRVFRGGDRVATRRVHNDDAAARGGVDVDVVNPDAGTADDAEFVTGVEDALGDFGLAAHDQRIVLADDLAERV